MSNNVQRQVFIERSQASETRTSCIEKVQGFFEGRSLVTFFTSFEHPVDINNDDCDMLQSILQHIDLKNGLVLMISSPGGDGLAAERIVKTCRAYSGTGDYWAIVPGRAKSAATIISMGASKIYMGAPSELGPVDPQVIRREGSAYKYFSAYGLVAGYENLFDRAVKTDGNLEPFIQQLDRYDERDINNYRDLIQLSENIAIKVLRSGMMAGHTEEEVKKKIGIFLDPAKGTISHGRPINRDEARECGLTIEDIDVNTDRWKAIYELYARTELYVSSRHAAKAAESLDESFMVSPPNDD